MAEMNCAYLSDMGDCHLSGIKRLGNDLVDNGHTPPDYTESLY